MVELYCELLLARANVLDQIAFGDGGQKARNKAKELYKRLNAPSAAAAGKLAPEEKAGAGGSGGIGFPFRGFGKKPTPHTEPSRETQEGDNEEEEKFIDPALDEAAMAIFYSWSRFPHDVRELTILRTLLADRWGKEFMALAQDNKVDGVPVPERLVKGLRVRAPSQDLVESYLAEIARAYGVTSFQTGTGDEGKAKEGPSGSPPEEFGDPSADRGDGGGGEGGDEADTATTAAVRRPSDPSDLPRTSPPRGLHPGRSPVSVAPPAPRTDNPSPRVKLPDTNAQADSKNEEVTPPSARGPAGAGAIPEVDELSRRFASLRR